MSQAYVLTGQLSDSRSLVLDEPVPLSDGRVRVTVQAMTNKKSKSLHFEILAKIHARLRAAGHIPSTREEIDRSIQEERNSWD